MRLSHVERRRGGHVVSVCIHQFLPAATSGDGVSGGALFARKLLRQLGVCSNIYTGSYTGEATGDFHLLDSFDPSECELLLVHHSMGHEFEGWIKNVCCPKVLIYHNITPARFFAEGSPEFIYSIKGREQLACWVEDFVGAIGDSPYNSQELLSLGYPAVETLPLLLELERFNGAEYVPECMAGRMQRPFILSVGRIAENKRPHLLIEAMYYLTAMSGGEQVPQLVLVGGTTSPAYEHALRTYVGQLGLQDTIVFAGKLADSELRWLYARAQAYWCASEHEGFCIPLVEAGFFGLPVISCANSNIPHTLGAAGLLLEWAEPQALAAVTAELIEDKALQQALKLSGLENLQRYQESTLLPQLRDYLLSLNLNLNFRKPIEPVEVPS